jgi:P4 family phage/plasmid primase-like protien
MYYKKKNVALQKLSEAPKGILANRRLTDYFIVSGYHQFLKTIKAAKSKDFYEVIRADLPVNPFFDIEVYPDHEYFHTPQDLLNLVKQAFASDTEYTPRFIVLEAHDPAKKSFHIVVRMTNEEGEHVYLKDVSVCKQLYAANGFDKITGTKEGGCPYKLIDPSVYREGLFRTVFSTKNGEKRPFTVSEFSDAVDDLLFSFVGHCCLDQSHVLLETWGAEEECLRHCTTSCTVPEDLRDSDRLVIKNFVKNYYHHTPGRVRDIFIDRERNCIVVALSELYCNFVDREHKSNHQYIVIDTSSSKQKCHDTECNEQKFHEIRIDKFPVEVHEVMKRCLRVNRQELELIDSTIRECKDYITENFDDSLDDIEFDRNELVFRGNVGNKCLLGVLDGKCKECKIEHEISNTGYCVKCIICKSVFPRVSRIPIAERYQNLNNFWNSYHQVINHGTVNINIQNIINNTEEEFINCDVKLHDQIFGQKRLTKLFNQCLDGHKVTKLAEILFTLHDDFVYNRSAWYFFDSSIWKTDDDNLEMKKKILGLSNSFYKIQSHYEKKATNDSAVKLIKNVKSIVNKLNKPALKDEVIKEAKIFYNNDTFHKMLNSKKHLISFTNGVYDLLTNTFRKTKKDDFINLTVGYAYDPSASSAEVHDFLNKVLPDQSVREYVLKKFSECLNGDIPNTNFLMFIGDGANGKSQLLNLMKLAMGEFGEKVEVTLLTRKRNNANEANTEKIKLLNKRYAFLSEPEDGEKINIGLLKELTGSEEIVARGLYQDSLSFVMEAKLFLACNELPEIKGEDNALWRRIRVIDFPSRFVENPVEANEFKIDKTLPSRMRVDIAFRQTFMNILLRYYNEDVIEPNVVKLRTNEYRNENSNMVAWFDENLEAKQGSVIALKDIYNLMYPNKPRNNRIMNSLKKEVEKYIKTTFPTLPYTFQDTTYQGAKYKGWLHVSIKNTD